MSIRRLRFFRDAACNVPVKSFSFGKLDAGDKIDADFYMKNVGFVAVDDVEMNVKVNPIYDKRGKLLPPKINAKLNTDSKVKRLGSQETYFGQVEIRANESAKAGEASFNVNVEGRISEEAG